MTTYTFPIRRGEVQYEVKCSSCGKLLRRKAVVEHTVNPFNKNEDGSIRTPAEVSARAHEEAKLEASKQADKGALCRQCEDRPINNLLIEMAGMPDVIAPEPVPLWGSPMWTLCERGYVERYFQRCNCGAPCCQGSIFKGFKITKSGIARVVKLGQAK